MFNLILILSVWQPEEVAAFPSELEADTIICLERIACINEQQEKVIWINPISQVTTHWNYDCTYNAMSFPDFKVWRLESGYTSWIMVSSSYTRWIYFKSILSQECD